MSKKPSVQLCAKRIENEMINCSGPAAWSTGLLCHLIVIARTKANCDSFI